MNAPLTNLVEQAVLDAMRAKDSFTALDISNQLKAERYPVAHCDVAETVREIYQSGAMSYYDYERKVIPVVTEGGSKKAQAFLYHFQEVRPQWYQRRRQDALPPVAPAQARDLADSAPAGLLPILARPACCAPRRQRQQNRRDGALSIPRHILTALGWTDGSRLSLSVNAGRLVIKASPTGGEALKVWSGQRLRICRTKLSCGALTAESVTVEVDGAGLLVSAAA